MLCDLHTHSIFSDGTLTPFEIVAEAKRENLIVALTDHNTVSGLSEFLSAGEQLNVEVVGGIEFSTEYHKKEIHLLGLFIKPDYFGMVESACKRSRDEKEKSNMKLLLNLRKAGYAITWAEVRSCAGSDNINRAAFAKCLFEKGMVSSVSDAFNTLLNKKSGMYEPPSKPDSLKVIEFIRKIGAVPVWAHPFSSVPSEKIETFLKSFKTAGLVGFESRYVDYSPSDEKRADELIKKYDLLPSGGSDFHGLNKPGILLGKGMGNLRVPHEYYIKLKAAVKY